MRLPILLLAALLAGCTGQALTQADRKAVEHPRQALSAANEHRRKGDWASALKILREAQRRNPDNARLSAALADLEAAWKREKQTLEDRLLLAESRGLSRQLPLLEELARLDPEDLAARTSLLALRLRLQGRARALDRCARHEGQSLSLRRSCAQLALKIAPDPGRRKQFSALEQNYQARVARWRARLALREAEQQARQRRALLEKARGLLDRGKYQAARNLLEEVLAKDSENREATELMIQLQSSLEGQIQALLRVGDALYREGALPAAIAAWQTVLSLAPEQPDARSKIQRARHVLKKLERLRREQGEGTAAR